MLGPTLASSLEILHDHKSLMTSLGCGYLRLTFFSEIFWTVKHLQAAKRDVFQHHMHHVLRVELQLATEHYTLAIYHRIDQTLQDARVLNQQKQALVWLQSSNQLILWLQLSDKATLCFVTKMPQVDVDDRWHTEQTRRVGIARNTHTHWHTHTRRVESPDYKSHFLTVL